MRRHLHIVHYNPTPNNKKRTRVDVLVDQIIDSAIVGGIAGLSAYVSAGVDASWKSALIAGVLTFLIKLKEYRNIT